MPADAGIKFGHYMLLRRIARGGMAEVFLAQQRGLEGFDRRVAVKRILPHLADSPDFVKMFLGEARLAAQLTHPNIVHIYEFGKVDHDYFIAMEFVDGVHAGQLFKAGGEGAKIPATLIARIGADAANALNYAHELQGPGAKPYGLVHRDVSPANIMVSFDGVVKLCDFGIAKAAALSDQLTNPGQVKGKYAYMSPEQTIAAPLDGRSDVFSLAIVLWELVVGKFLVSRGDAIDGMRAIRDGKIEPIEHAAPSVPAPLAKAIGWALQPKREHRATAGELAQALEAFIKQAPELATSMQLAGWVRGRFVRERTSDPPLVSAGGPVAGGGTVASPGTVGSPGTVIGPRTQGAVSVIGASQLLDGTGSYDASDLDETVETVKVRPPKFPSAPTVIDPTGKRAQDERSRRAAEEPTALAGATIVVTELVDTPPPVAVRIPPSEPRRRPTPPPTDSASRRRATPLPARRRLRIAIAAAGLVGLAATSFLIAIAASGSHGRTAGRDAAVPRPDAMALAATPLDAAAPQADAGSPSMLVEINTNPSGATIKVADQIVFAPTKLALPAGRYAISVELAGYQTERREFDLQLGDHPILEIALVRRPKLPVEHDRPPALGKLTVRTTPYSEVFEAGKRLGETPFADYELTAGPHILTFKNPAHPTIKKTITIIAGKPTKLNFALP